MRLELAPVFLVLATACGEVAPLFTPADGPSQPASAGDLAAGDPPAGAPPGDPPAPSAPGPDETCDPVVMARSDALVPDTLFASGDELLVDGAHVVWNVQQIVTPDTTWTAIARVPKAGGPAELRLLEPAEEGIVVSLALDGDPVTGWLTWSQFGLDVSSRLRRQPRAGGPTQLVARGEWFLSPLAVDETHVYVTEDFDGAKKLVRVLKDGAAPLGPFEPLADAPLPGDLLVDDVHVWLGLLDPTTEERQLHRVRKDGSAPAELAAHDASAADQDDAWVYALDEAGVVRVPKVGGPAERLAAPTARPAPLRSVLRRVGDVLFFTTRAEDAASDELPTWVWQVRTDGTALARLAVREAPIRDLDADGSHLFWLEGEEVVRLLRGCNEPEE